MSVLIKGMKMPKKCVECQFGEYEEDTSYFRCPLVKYVYKNIAEHTRIDECPLVELPEHHDRLIDADNTCADFNTVNPKY